MLQYDPRQAVFSQSVGVIAVAVGTLFTGWLGDGIPPRYLLRTGVALLLVFSYPFYQALASRSVPLTLLLGVALLGSLWVGRYGGNVLTASTTRERFGATPCAVLVREWARISRRFVDLLSLLSKITQYDEQNCTL